MGARRNDFGFVTFKINGVEYVVDATHLPGGGSISKRERQAEAYLLNLTGVPIGVHIISWADKLVTLHIQSDGDTVDPSWYELHTTITSAGSNL